eukprot:TRINITY_DN4199_c0_g1_i1.p1 TRINITY_DN4199_c0_g1~~TRINITY_DN4199_c0_g1_i1.p1  ORF type:complete len:312 (+),score=68.24 TRINITY_DN4199_c0_g1_i1:57-992(+)
MRSNLNMKLSFTQTNHLLTVKSRLFVGRDFHTSSRSVSFQTENDNNNLTRHFPLFFGRPHRSFHLDRSDLTNSGFSLPHSTSLTMGRHDGSSIFINRPFIRSFSTSNDIKDVNQDQNQNNNEEKQKEKENQTKTVKNNTVQTPPMSKGERVFESFMFTVTLIGVVGALSALGVLKEGSDSLEWQQTEAKIDNGQVTQYSQFRPGIKNLMYTYRVGDKEFHGTRLQRGHFYFGIEEPLNPQDPRTKQIEEAVRNKATINIFYHPEMPERATLVQGYDPAVLSVYLPLFVLMAARRLVFKPLARILEGRLQKK